jgi:anti-sigma B factor antagonist
MAEARFQTEGPRTLRVEGEVDTSNTDALEEALLAHAGGDGDVVVDLAQLTFIDSSGFRVLIRAAKALEGRGRLVLRSAPPLVGRLIDTLGLASLDELLVIEPSDQPASDDVAASDGSVSGSQR